MDIKTASTCVIIGGVIGYMACYFTSVESTKQLKEHILSKELTLQQVTQQYQQQLAANRDLTIHSYRETIQPDGTKITEVQDSTDSTQVISNTTDKLNMVTEKQVVSSQIKEESETNVH